MRVGDIVKWIGFPGATVGGIRATGPTCTGIIIKIHEGGWSKYRVDVQWGDGTFGSMLYPQTIEVVREPLKDEEAMWRMWGDQ